MLASLRRTPFGVQILLGLVLGVLLGLVAQAIGPVGTADGPAPNWLTSTLTTIGSAFEIGWPRASSTSAIRYGLTR